MCLFPSSVEVVACAKRGIRGCRNADPALSSSGRINCNRFQRLFRKASNPLIVEGQVPPVRVERLVQLHSLLAQGHIHEGKPQRFGLYRLELCLSDEAIGQSIRAKDAVYDHARCLRYRTM